VVFAAGMGIGLMSDGVSDPSTLLGGNMQEGGGVHGPGAA